MKWQVDKMLINCAEDVDNFVEKSLSQDRPRLAAFFVKKT